MNVVSIMAHQDDEMRCLGAMLRCRQRGDSLFFITVTDGCQGVFDDSGMASREDAAGIRHAEMTALAAELGAGYINLREEDEFLYDRPELRIRLVEAIRSTGAQLVFTHYTEDYNTDHTTVCSLVRQCAMLACVPTISPETKTLVEHPAIFMVEPHGPVQFPASHYVDIGTVYDEKIKLLQLHKSQDSAIKATLGHGLAEMVGVIDSFRGSLTGCQHAEAFCPMQARGAIKAWQVLP